MSAGENLQLPLSLAGIRPDPDWFDTIVTAAQLQPHLAKAPATLSPATQQLLAAARALMGRPHILLADEPTGRLSAAASEALLRFLKWARASAQQSTVLFTHDPLIAAEADRVLFLQDGRINSEIADPSPVSVLSRIAELDASRRAWSRP